MEKLIKENKLNKLIDEVMQKNELLGEQVAIGGFSQGCMISLLTGIKRRDKINSRVFRRKSSRHCKKQYT